MARSLRTAPPPRPQRDTEADDNSAGTQPHQSNGSDIARTKNGIHSRREYGILVPEETEWGRANMGPWVRGDGHRATRGIAKEEWMVTKTGIETRQRALLARGLQEDGNEE